jgi:hypothetical protein
VVVLSSGQELRYDYCCISTGSSYPAPVKADFAAAASTQGLPLPLPLPRLLR